MMTEILPLVWNSFDSYSDCDAFQSEVCVSNAPKAESFVPQNSVHSEIGVCVSRCDAPQSVFYFHLMPSDAHQLLNCNAAPL